MGIAVGSWASNLTAESRLSKSARDPRRVDAVITAPTANKVGGGFHRLSLESRARSVVEPTAPPTRDLKKRRQTAGRYRKL
jgi:hypothetical protein